MAAVGQSNAQGSNFLKEIVRPAGQPNRPLYMEPTNSHCEIASQFIALRKKTRRLTCRNNLLDCFLNRDLYFRVLAIPNVTQRLRQVVRRHREDIDVWH